MRLGFVDVYPRLKAVGGDVGIGAFVGGWVDFWETRYSELIPGPIVSPTRPVAIKCHDGETRHPRSG